MSNKKEKTVGKAVLDLVKKNPEGVVTFDEVDSRTSDFNEEFFKAVNRGCAHYIGIFFIEIRLKLEKVLLDRVIKRDFIPKVACPRPEYDQTIYQIDPTSNEIKLLWCIPKKDTCLFIMEHGERATEYGILKELVRDTHLFADKSLERFCNKLNGEIKGPKINNSFNVEDWKHQGNLVVQSQ